MPKGQRGSGSIPHLTFLSFLSHTAGCLSDVRGQSVPGSRERKMGSNTVGASLQTLCVMNECVCVSGY